MTQFQMFQTREFRKFEFRYSNFEFLNSNSCLENMTPGWEELYERSQETEHSEEFGTF